MNRRVKTRTVQRAESRELLRKAEEFFAACEDALAHERPTAAGLAAIHAGISASDAVAAARLGKTSAAPEHSASVMLLREAVADVPERTVRHLVGLLNAKHVVAYEARMLSDAEARRLVDAARRFLAWASDVVR